MSAIVSAPKFGSFESVASQAVSYVKSTVSSVILWEKNRRTRNALSRLSDHELDDIGLTRGDIDELGFKIARGR